jgi:hypothetical protein
MPGQRGQAYIAPGQPGQVYVVPAPMQQYPQMQPASGSAWFAGPPGQVMPGCIVPAPSALAPGRPILPPLIRRLSLHRLTIVGPGVRPRHIWISRPPIIKSLIGIPGHCTFQFRLVPPPIVKRFIAIPGRCSVHAQIGRLVLPKRIVSARPGRWVQISISRLRASWRVVLIGPPGRRAIAIPGGVRIGKALAGPACVIVPVPPPAG